jgi:hypothetical protein
MKKSMHQHFSNKRGEKHRILIRRQTVHDSSSGFVLSFLNLDSSHLVQDMREPSFVVSLQFTLRSSHPMHPLKHRVSSKEKNVDIVFKNHI